MQQNAGHSTQHSLAGMMLVTKAMITHSPSNDTSESEFELFWNIDSAKLLICRHVGLNYRSRRNHSNRIMYGWTAGTPQYTGWTENNNRLRKTLKSCKK